MKATVLAFGKNATGPWWLRLLAIIGDLVLVARKQPDHQGKGLIIALFEEAVAEGYVDERSTNVQQILTGMVLKCADDSSELLAKLRAHTYVKPKTDDDA